MVLVTRLEPEEVCEGILAIQVGEQARSVELLVLGADGAPDRVERAAALAMAAPGAAWVTVPTDQREARLADLRNAGLEMECDPEWLMTVDLTTRPLTELHSRHVVESEQRADVVVAQVMINGVVLASGRMAVAGSDAVADRIETDPAYRRLGLGRAVMDALVADAVGMGATRGVLAASSDGLALYQSLGWTAVTDLVIARSL